jgi:hypothetical protein
MENADEPNYFTEKFVEAVIAGCVPVYHANRSVRDTFLTGAVWFDPADYGFDPKATIDAALNADRDAVAAANRSWLQSNSHVVASRGENVMQALGNILRECAGDRRDAQ